MSIPGVVCESDGGGTAVLTSLTHCLQWLHGCFRES